jgi:hypothetical protein
MGDRTLTCSSHAGNAANASIGSNFRTWVKASLSDILHPMRRYCFTSQSVTSSTNAQANYPWMKSSGNPTRARWTKYSVTDVNSCSDSPISGVRAAASWWSLQGPFRAPTIPLHVAPAGTLCRISAPTEWWIDEWAPHGLSKRDQPQLQTVGETLSETWISQTSVAYPRRHWNLHCHHYHIQPGLCLQLPTGGFQISSSHATCNSLSKSSRRFRACYLTNDMAPFNCLYSMSVIVSEIRFQQSLHQLFRF